MYGGIQYEMRCIKLGIMSHYKYNLTCFLKMIRHKHVFRIILFSYLRCWFYCELEKMIMLWESIGIISNSHLITVEVMPITQMKSINVLPSFFLSLVNMEQCMLNFESDDLQHLFWMLIWRQIVYWLFRVTVWLNQANDQQPRQWNCIICN